MKGKNIVQYVHIKKQGFLEYHTKEPHNNFMASCPDLNILIDLFIYLLLTAHKC